MFGYGYGGYGGYYEGEGDIWAGRCGATAACARESPAGRHCASSCARPRRPDMSAHTRERLERSKQLFLNYLQTVRCCGLATTAKLVPRTRAREDESAAGTLPPPAV